MNFIPRLKKFFTTPDVAAFASLEHPALYAQTLIRVYYAVLLYFAMMKFPQWNDIMAFQEWAVLFPLWPVQWISALSFHTDVYIIRIFFIATAMLAVFFPRFRINRILVFAGLLEFVSLYASVQFFDADWYVLFLPAFLFIFLPSGWHAPTSLPLEKRANLLFIFWGAQAAVLLTYSMAEIGKIIYGFSQFIQGEHNIFSIDATARQIANQFFTANEIGALGPLVIDNPIIAWPLSLVFIYFFLFSFLAAFRPKLHSLWGGVLICFHIASYLTMGIGFFTHVLLLAILFLPSPFIVDKIRWQDVLHDMPLLGRLMGSARKL